MSAVERRLPKPIIHAISIVVCATGLTIMGGGIADLTVIHPGLAVRVNNVNKQYLPIPSSDQIKAAEQTIVDFGQNPSPTDDDRQKEATSETLIAKEKARVNEITELKSHILSDIFRFGSDAALFLAGGTIALTSLYKGKQALDSTFMGPPKKPKD